MLGVLLKYLTVHGMSSNLPSQSSPIISNDALYSFIYSGFKSNDSSKNTWSTHFSSEMMDNLSF